MVEASAALASWWDATVGKPVGPGITGLVEALGGDAGKSALAHELARERIAEGRTYKHGEQGAYAAALRNVQRYTTSGAQTRTPKALQGALDRIRERLAPKAGIADRIKRDGLTVARFAGEMIVSGKSRTVDRSPSGSDQHIRGDDLAAFIEAAEAEEWSEAAKQWQRAFFGDDQYTGAYVVPGAELPEITRLDMQIG